MITYFDKIHKYAVLQVRIQTLKVYIEAFSSTILYLYQSFDTQFNKMLKLSAICVLLTAVAVAFGCDTSCSAAQDRYGRCYYSCTDGACHMSGVHHRDQFLNGLSTRGYDCKPEGYNTLSCAKTGNFGGCWGHKWTCGQGC